MFKLELSLHSIICGRTRKNIRLIESISDTAIYFPPPFPHIYGYIPFGAHRRGEDEVYITGKTQENITLAKKKLHELVTSTKCYVKDVAVNAAKIDSIILDRLDKVRKVMELNGSYVLFPPLGSLQGLIRVQGTEILHVERTVREIMALVRAQVLASYCYTKHSLYHRLVNSTVLHGGCHRQILLMGEEEPTLLLNRSNPCLQIFASTQVPTLDSRSSTLSLMDLMMRSRLL